MCISVMSYTIQLLFSVSGDAPSEVGSTYWNQRVRAKVSEWLNLKVGTSDVTSGVGSMSPSASHMEKLESPLLDENHKATRWFPSKMKLDSALHGGVSTDIVETQRRHSF